MNPKNLVIGLLIACGLIAAAPLLIPYNLFKGDLEKKLSAINHGATTISNVSFSYSPTPIFSLENVIIENAETAKMSEVIIPVTSYNLLNFGSHLRDVVVRHGEFSRSFAIDLPKRLKTNPSGGFKIDRLKLEQATVKLDAKVIGPIDGELRFKSSGEIDELLISADQGRAELQLQPAEAGHFKVQLNAKSWELPLGYPVKFDFLKLMGTANLDGIQISDIRGDLYGGLITGSAQLSWGDEWQLTGQLFGKNIHVEPLITLFSPITRSTGRMNSDATFRYKSANYNQLFKQPMIQGRFVVQEGTLHNFDLITPLKSQSPSVQRRGGQTNFNTLSGGIVINGSAVNLQSVILESGKFRSTGNLLIRDGKIAGSVSSQIAAGAVTVSNALNVTGALDAPELRSGGANRPQSATVNNGEATPEAPRE